MKRLFLFAGALFILMSISITAVFAEDSEWEPYPDRDWVFTQEYGVESLTFRAAKYSELENLPQSVTFLLGGCRIESPQVHKLDGVALAEMLLKPEGDSTRVTLKLACRADGFSINFAPASRAFPKNGSVIVAFTGLRKLPAGGAQSEPDDEYPDMSAPKQTGDYELPEFEARYKYSDALVTIHTRGASIKGLLDFMAAIGGISIVLDPYWDQEPTGTGRPPISGMGGGGEGGAEGFGTGGAPGQFGGFGSGAVSIDLDEVPFDFALDMIITSAGLVYFDIG